MVNKTSLHWKSDVWPDSLKAESVRSLSGRSPAAVLTSSPLRWHYSFAIGFFGFHYIRAVKDNDTVLRSESLQILKKLLSACGLDENLLEDTNIPKKRVLLDFWEQKIRRFSLVLGDSVGLGSQRTVELGYWLAAAYAGLVAESRGSDTEGLTHYLGDFESHLSNLVLSSQSAEIPASLISPLVDSIKILRQSKTRRSASKSMQGLRLMFKKILLLRTEEVYFQEN